jgi:hypothetical protein
MVSRNHFAGMRLGTQGFDPKQSCKGQGEKLFGAGAFGGVGFSEIACDTTSK